MQKNEVLQLIDEKLAQLQEAEKRNKWNERLSFGVHLQAYRQSPFMEAFLKKRKQLQREILLTSFGIPMMFYLLDSKFYDQLQENFLKAAVFLLVNTIFWGLVLRFAFIRAVALHTNNAQHEVKKMMLTDLRQKIEQLECKPEMA